jgi:thiamine biosynthesis lipoprotein
MACQVAILLPEHSTGLAEAREALAEADRVEAAWSIFRRDSALSDVNRHAFDEPHPVSHELAHLLTRCASLTAATGGAFDITATPLSRCWGLLDRHGAVPGCDQLRQARALVGMHHVSIDLAADPPTVRFDRRGVELNLGAIGKGYAVGCIARHLRARGVAPALVSAGDSSIEAVDAPRGGWQIGLRGHGAGVRLRLTRGATGTSGSAEQSFADGHRRRGHVIDPRTGEPVDAVRRVTVVTDDAATADALSTAFLIGGPPLARDYLDRHDETLVIFSLGDQAAPVIMGRASGATVEGV